jgi:hypothetical protein
MFRWFIILLTAILIAQTDRAFAAEGESHEVKLPAKVDKIVRAGNGNVLLLEMDSLGKVAVFDTKAEKITGYVSLGGNDTLIAGNSDSILLLVRDKKILQRWSIVPLEKKLTVLCPFEDVDGFVAGYASSVPAMVMTRSGVRFINTTNLSEFKPEMSNQMSWWQPHPQYPIFVAVSADGTTFGGWQVGVSPSGFRYLRLDNKKITVKYEHQTVGPQIPSADGSLIFTNAGIYDSDLKPLGHDRQRVEAAFPTMNSAYYCSVSTNNRDGGASTATLSLFTTADRTLLITFDKLEGLDEAQSNFNYQTGPSIADRVTVDPVARKMLIVDPAGSLVRIYPLDILKALNDKGIDYLFVESTPVTKAAAGSDYEYPVKVMSKAGNVKFSLDSCPEGMTITAEGMIHWKVPSAIAEPHQSVILSIQDGSDQSIFHTFSIDVTSTTQQKSSTPATRD